MARPQRQPLDQDRNVIISVSSVDGITPVPLEVNPANGQLLVSSSGGSADVQYTDGATAVANPIGTQPVFTNSGGVVKAVSSTNPLPVSGSVIPAGTNIIGKVSIDQTTPGTTNNVEITGHSGAPIKDDTLFGDGVTSGVLTTAVRIFNGTNYDRIRSVSAVTGTSGTGAIATGAIALGKTANPTAVTDGQQVEALTDKLGKLIVVGSIRDLKGDQATTLTSTTTETTIITAVASTFLDLYGLNITNTSATATEVIIRDVTAGTPRFSFMVPANDTRGFMLPEGAAYKQATVNTAWTAQCGTSVASIKISALYVKNI